jgi:DNA polymerase IV
MDRIILHIDMDAFFAAVEQLDQPEYRGKPVVVGADPKRGKGRGVVSTCSYEARKYGIHSAMPISQAYARCPFAIYLPGRMRRYQEISRQIMDILYNFSPIVEPISIDEAFLDISGCLRLLGSPRVIAIAIKEKIRTEIGLTASIGIAPSKFIAKIASDLQKPDGLVIVTKEQTVDFLKPLPISKMWGVGKKTEPLLLKYGIKTIGDLAAYSQDKIINLFGKSGLHFWSLANGLDDREVITHDAAKSVSQEITFEQDTDDPEEIKKTLYYLCNELSRILRSQKLKGRTITLKIRLADFSTFTRSYSHCEYTNSSKIIVETIFELFSKFDTQGQKIRLLGVAVSNLNTQFGDQISIFDQPTDHKERSDEVMQLIQSKFGVEAIKKASLIDRHPYRLSDQKIKKSDES